MGSSSGAQVIKWGSAIDDSFVPADYDGDGKTDLAVFRDEGWYVRRSSDNSLLFTQFGFGNDIPAARFPF